MVDNGNTLEVLVTVDDSDTYNQPWQGLRWNTLPSRLVLCYGKQP
jgi:hypothetical protein